MVMLAEHYDFVIGGDPDRDTIDLAILDTVTGGVRGHLADRADGLGYLRLLAWAREHAPGRRVWALEGTGSFAAGLVMVLAEAGEDIVEITGESDPAARRTTVSTQSRPFEPHWPRKTKPRPVNGACVKRCVRFSFPRQAVLVSRTKAINELKSLIVVAPEHLRAQLRGLRLIKQLDRVEQLRSPAGPSVEHRITILTLQSITARIRFLLAQTAELDPELLALVKSHPAGPVLLAEPGVGPVVAAQLLVSWSHRGRVRSEAAFATLAGAAPLEASSGQRTRHRLSRGGDRDLNRALHTIAITRLRCHQESRDYEANRTVQGKTHRDVRRSLKRILARRLYRRIQAATRQPTPSINLAHGA
ncbi:transposase [Micromonospora sp. NPDC005161]